MRAELQQEAVSLEIDGALYFYLRGRAYDRFNFWRLSPPSPWIKSPERSSTTGPAAVTRSGSATFDRRKAPERIKIMTTLETIYKNINSGATYGQNVRGCAGNIYYVALSVSDDGRYINYSHYGSSAVANTPEELLGLLDTIYHKTPEEFTAAYVLEPCGRWIEMSDAAKFDALKAACSAACALKPANVRAAGGCKPAELVGDAWLRLESRLQSGDPRPLRDQLLFAATGRAAAYGGPRKTRTVSAERAGSCGRRRHRAGRKGTQCPHERSDGAADRGRRRDPRRDQRRRRGRHRRRNYPRRRRRVYQRRYRRGYWHERASCPQAA